MIEKGAQENLFIGNLFTLCAFCQLYENADLIVQQVVTPTSSLVNMVSVYLIEERMSLT